RVPGTVLGTLAVANLPQRSFAVLVGVFVLICVGISVTPWRPRASAPTVCAAGFVGGVTGTASAIGGPPVALLYQHERGARIRATLSAYMVFGGLVSLGGLALGGQISGTEIGASAALIPL